MLVAPAKPVQVKEAAVNPILKAQRVRTIAGKASAESSSRNAKHSQSSAKLATEREMLANRNTTDLRRRRLSSNLLAETESSSSLTDLRRVGSTDLMDPQALVPPGGSSSSSSSSSSGESEVEAIEELVPLHLMTEAELVQCVAQGASADEIRLWLRRVCPISEDDGSVLLSVPGSPCDAAPVLDLDVSASFGVSPSSNFSHERRHNGRVMFPPVQDGALHKQIIGLQWERDWRVSFSQMFHKPKELISPEAPAPLPIISSTPKPPLTTKNLLSTRTHSSSIDRPHFPRPPLSPTSPRLKMLTEQLILNRQSPGHQSIGSPTPFKLSPPRSSSPARRAVHNSLPRSRKVSNPTDLVEVPARLKEALELCRNPPLIVGQQQQQQQQAVRSPGNRELRSTNSPVPSILPRDLIAGAKKVAEERLHVRQFIVNFAHEISKRPDLVSLHLHHAPLGLFESVYLVRRGLCAMQYSSLQRLTLSSCGIDGAALTALLAWVSRGTGTPQLSSPSGDSATVSPADRGSTDGEELFDLDDDSADSPPDQLHTLDLSHNTIQSKDLPILCDIILRCPSLVCVSIKDNPICEETEETAPVEPPSSHNGGHLPGHSAASGNNPTTGTTITVRANREFANLLALTPQLESLDVSFCNLGDGEIIKLCHRLFERKCSILRLCIDGANITTSVSTLLLETIEITNRSLFQFSAKYVCNCSTFNFKRKVNAALRRNIRHCLKKGTESTLYNYLRRNERLMVPPHPTLEKMLAETKVGTNRRASAAAGAAGATAEEMTILVGTGATRRESILNDSESEADDVEPSVRPSFMIDDDEDKEDAVIREWGGWEDRGLREGYHGYTSNDPSLVKRRGHFPTKPSSKGRR